jgi:hypothetical protein
MTTENQNPNPDDSNKNLDDPTGTDNNNQDQNNQQDIEKVVQERIDNALKEIKTKLDSAFSQRDEALKKLAEIEQAEKDAHKKRLEEEGKHKELYELQLAEEKAKRETAEKRNTELTRDVSVREALSNLTFRNDAANAMAYKEILSNLRQDENGEWKHQNGTSISQYVEQFSKDEKNSFLFEPKVNTGAGTSASSGTSTSSEKKSLFELSQAEVLKLASEGKL